MSFGNYITLKNLAKIPQIGLGTWLSKPREVEHAVRNTVIIRELIVTWLE
jgi:L-glyceraldehyde reductase